MRTTLAVRGLPSSRMASETIRPERSVRAVPVRIERGAARAVARHGAGVAAVRERSTS